MDLTKRYQDEEGNPRNILEMVGQFPEWAANRIQEGEKAASQISALEAKCRDLEQQLAPMTAERDSESRWAKQYHDEAVALRNRIAMALDTIQIYKQEICDE